MKDEVNDPVGGGWGAAPLKVKLLKLDIGGKESEWARERGGGGGGGSV